MRILLLTVFMLFTGVAHASTPTHIKGKYVPEAAEVGATRLKYLFWDVYDISLHAPEGEFRFSGPFALDIHYLLDLKGKDIAKVARKEIKRQGINETHILDSWHQQLEGIFPDVKKGDRITGFYGQDGYAYFYKNGEFIGSIQDPEFAVAFFKIWLGEETSQPQMRRALLGADS